MTSLTTEQMVTYTFKIVDGRGRPVKVDGDPVVASADETVVTVSALRNDGSGNYSFDASAVSVGAARVAVTADADLSPAVSDVVATDDITVTLDPRTAARTIALTAGTPTDTP